MRRRNFITLLGGAAVAWPLASRAQQPERMRSIGVLMGYAESDQGKRAVSGSPIKRRTEVKNTLPIGRIEGSKTDGDPHAPQPLLYQRHRPKADVCRVPSATSGMPA